MNKTDGAHHSSYVVFITFNVTFDHNEILIKERLPVHGMYHLLLLLPVAS